jgi:UDP-N-acetylmuramoyl-tripeptide--D-alanyl-D-alanine ligase
MKRPLDWAAAKLGHTMRSTEQITSLEAEIKGWSVDSRTIQPGELFFALRGPHFDGHAYIPDALAKGAAGAIGETGAATIRVTDSLAALQRLASEARLEWGGEVVAVTGSAGKTTTKEVIAGMLSEEFKTAKTEGNLNNHVGLPLTLLRTPEEARAAVLEMGMNHPGEIRVLARIAKANVGVVTNVGWAHIEAFDSIEGIAAAKRELVEELGPEGVAVLNADDDRVAAFAKVHSGRTVLYGQSTKSEVRAENVRVSLDGVTFHVGRTVFASPMTGRHSVSNLLAGIAVAGLYGISPERLRERVGKIRPGKMRGERFTQGGVLVYNDCYNSNPDAARAMLDVLRDTPARRRIAVLGEMLELGRWAEPLHREVGNYAAMCGVDVLVGIRGAAGHMLDAAIGGGLRADAAFFFDQPAPAGHFVRSIAQPGDVVLFKGSRGVHVELAVEQFLSEGRN